MRKGEILSLQWNDINLENKVLTVDFQNAKSGNTRHIPLNKQAFNVLSDWQKISGNIGYVFKDNKQQRILDFRYNWAALLEDANITDFRFHDLRHHFASKLVN